MAKASKCLVGHKGCACRLVCCRVQPDRAEEIAEDARSGVNWSEGASSAACTCGAFLAGSTVSSQGYLVDKTVCHRHGVRQPSRVTPAGSHAVDVGALQAIQFRGVEEEID